MKSFGAILFGVLAFIATLFAGIWTPLGPFRFLGAIPFWLLFLVRALKP